MANPRNIAVVLKTNEGGQWVLPQMRQLSSMGHKVTLVIPTGGGRLQRQAVSEGFAVRTIGFDFNFRKAGRAVAGLLELRRALSSLKPDLVFYHLYASALASRFSTLGLGAKRVHMVAGPAYLESAPIRLVEGFLSSMDDVLIAGSEYTYRKYEKLIGPGPKRLTMTPYGTDCEARQPATVDEKVQLRRRYGFEPGEFIAVFVAFVYAPKGIIDRKVGLKGHETAIAAWREFQKLAPNSRLLMIGGGFGAKGEQHRDRLLSVTKDLPSVSWLGSVEDVSDYYRLADISISPSLTENHGAALEAGAYGIPSIVSSAGGLPEMLPDRGGWVIDPGNSAQLANALQESYLEYGTGDLKVRGRLVRRHIHESYSWSFTLPAIADEVVSVTHPGPLTIYSEARFTRDVYGRVFSTDSANTDSQWRRYASVNRRPRVVARCDLGSGSDRVERIRLAEIAPLPPYRGMAGLLRSSSRIVQICAKEVRHGGLPVVRLPGPIPTLAGLSAIALRRPFAAELVGDIEGVSESGVLPAFVPARLLGGITRFVVKRAAAVRYVTEKTLQERYPSSASHVHSVPNVVLDDLYSGGFVRRQLTGGEATILCVGGMSNSYKGHEYALLALRNLRQRGCSVRLRLVGDGAHRPKLAQIASDLDLDGLVEFTGALDRTGVAQAYDAADVFLQPSLTEGMPRTVIEAMAKGLPVVATNVGGSRELVDSVFLVPTRDGDALAERIALLLTSPRLYSETSERNLLFAKRYAGEVVEKQFESWVRVLLEVAKDD